MMRTFERWGLATAAAALTLAVVILASVLARVFDRLGRQRPPARPFNVPPASRGPWKEWRRGE